MNSKIEKINEFLVKNQLAANGREIVGDPYHTMLVSVNSVHDLGFYIFVGDDPIVGCKCVLATEVDPSTPGLLLLLNKLTSQYKTHSYTVDEDGILCAKFAMFFDKDKFDADDLFGYCSLVDHHVVKDIPEIFTLLGREVPEAVLDDKRNDEVKTQLTAEEAGKELMDIPVPTASSAVSEGSGEVNNIE